MKKYEAIQGFSAVSCQIVEMPQTLFYLDGSIEILNVIVWSIGCVLNSKYNIKPSKNSNECLTDPKKNFEHGCDTTKIYFVE